METKNSYMTKSVEEINKCERDLDPQHLSLLPSKWVWKQHEEGSTKVLHNFTTSCQPEPLV